MNRQLLLTRLLKAQTGSCNCCTKTPDPQWHKEDCRYRVLREAEEFISQLPEETPSPYEKAMDELVAESQRLGLYDL